MSELAQTVLVGNQQLKAHYQELERNNSFWLDSSQLLTAFALMLLYTGMSEYFAYVQATTGEASSWWSYATGLFFLLSVGFCLNGLRAWYFRYEAFGKQTYNDKRNPGGEGYPLSSMRLNQIFLFLIGLFLVYALMPSAHALSVINMGTVDVDGAVTALAAQLIVLGGAVLAGVLVIFAASAGVPLGKRMIWSML